uniref:Macaca fascicularis brain cDNA, clone: QflA-17559 n=2 Tax=Macaca TaxID=9539 RepID=I7G5F4_MACFA|nr:unnamed protein product [Macaca fascicularis]
MSWNIQAFEWCLACSKYPVNFSCCCCCFAVIIIIPLTPLCWIIHHSSPSLQDI